MNILSNSAAAPPRHRARLIYSETPAPQNTKDWPRGVACNKSEIYKQTRAHFELGKMSSLFSDVFLIVSHNICKKTSNKYPKLMNKGAREQLWEPKPPEVASEMLVERFYVDLSWFWIPFWGVTLALPRSHFSINVRGQFLCWFILILGGFGSSFGRLFAPHKQKTNANVRFSSFSYPSHV